jgi:hypothetical protein
MHGSLTAPQSLPVAIVAVLFMLFMGTGIPRLFTAIPCEC